VSAVLLILLGIQMSAILLRLLGIQMSAVLFRLLGIQMSAVLLRLLGIQMSAIPRTLRIDVNRTACTALCKISAFYISMLALVTPDPDPARGPV
jgi:uncharacterized membrane protein YedE/YeeE